MAYESLEQSMRDVATAADATNAEYNGSILALAEFSWAAMPVMTALSDVQGQIEALNLDPNDPVAQGVLSCIAQSASQLSAAIPALNSATMYISQLNGALTTVSGYLNAAATMLASIDPDANGGEGG